MLREINQTISEKIVHLEARVFVEEGNLNDRRKKIASKQQ